MIILVIILLLKHNPEAIEIKYAEDSCRPLKLDVLVLTLVCRQIENCAFSVRRKIAKKRSAGKYHLILKLKHN